MEIDSNLTTLGNTINEFSLQLSPIFGTLTGEILGGLIIASLTLLITLLTFVPWKKIWRFFTKAELYVLMPTETEYNREHLAHQINGFKIFLNQDTNKKLKFKFVMVKEDVDEINDFINKIAKKKIILITSMSFVFNQTLVRLVEKNRGKKGKINKDIKLIGTLGSESKELKKVYQPENIIRIFPPDYDEAKIAYEFFYHKLLSYFCNNKECPHSYFSNNLSRAYITIYHSESYGAALSRKFKDYFDDNSKNDEVNPFGEQNAKDFMTLNICDFDEENLNLTQDASFHFIFLVGYEPNISKMIKNIFKETENKNIDLNKICFLFSPTVGVPEWKKDVCKTINSKNGTSIDIKKIFYLKSKIPGTKYQFRTNQEESNPYNVKLDFYDYNLTKLKISQELKNKIKILNIKPNYINIFAYLALRVAKIIHRKSWNESLHTIKYEAFKEVLGSKTSNKPKIYYNGDSIGHFIIRPFECDFMNKEVRVISSKSTQIISKKRKGKRK